jgi:hypothetical protein
MEKNFESPVKIFNNFKYKFKERSELEERLNMYYGSSKFIQELSLETKIYESNTFGNLFSFLPARIYTFDYVYMNDSKMRNCVDFRPMVLVKEDYLKDGDYRVKGFNINFLPKEYKVQLMELYTQFFSNELDRDIQMLNESKTSITIYDKTKIDDFFLSVERYLPKVYNSMRIWSKAQIPRKNVKFIKLQDYDKIFEYSGFVRTIKGKHWRTIQIETIS